MPEVGNYSAGNADAQKIIVNNLLSAVRDRHFSQTILLLEMLAESFNDIAVKEKINKVKSRTSIEFGTFEMLYHMSFRMDPRRGVVLKHAYYAERIPFPQIRRMFEEEIIKPCTEIAVELVGRISVDKSVFLEEYIKSKSVKSVADEVRSRPVKVIM